MATRRRSKNYRGVYIVEGVNGLSYGIDYSNPVTGERVQKILKGCTSEREACDLRSIEIADAARGAIEKAYSLKKATRPLLFEKAVDLYAEWAEQNKKSYYVEKFKYDILRNHFKGKLISDIHPMMIEAFRVRRLKEVGKKTVNQEIIIARQAIKKVIELKQYKGQNPFEEVKNYKVPKGKKPGYLTAEEVQAIMQQIDHPTKRDMVAFAYYAGWRISEIRSLTWDNVNLDEGIAYLLDPKNDQTARMVLSDNALEYLKRQPRRGPFVFCKKNGDPYKTAMNGIIGSAAERAGVALPDGKKWHAFRRSWTTAMIQAGCDLATLQDTGNWKDPSMPLWYMESARDEGKRKYLNSIPSIEGENARNTLEMAEEAKSS